MKRKAINLIAVIFTLGLLQSCSDDDKNIVKPELANYTLVTKISSGDHNFNFYAQNIDDLSKVKTYTNENATEVLKSDAAGITPFNGALYLNSYVNKKKVTKWIPNANGIYENRGEVSITDLGNSGNVCFKDANTAFVGGNASTKIAIFNPTTMKRTGAIDFSSVSKVGTITNFPTKDDKINIAVPTEMIISGNYMYVGFMHLKDFNSSTPAVKGVDVLVIDLRKVDVNKMSNKEAIVKWTSDTRGVGPGSFNSGHGAKFMIKDEAGDVYILCHNMWGGHRETTGKPSCLLRINRGKTDFDTDYYFDLETVSRGLGSPVINLEYVGNGSFYATSIDLAKIDENNPWSFYIDPISQWYKFNLTSKTAKKVTEEYTKGSNTAITYNENGKVYIPIENKTENFVLEVNNSTLESKRTLTTAGAAVIVKL